MKLKKIAKSVGMHIGEALGRFYFGATIKKRLEERRAKWYERIPKALTGLGVYVTNGIIAANTTDYMCESLGIGGGSQDDLVAAIYLGTIIFHGIPTWVIDNRCFAGKKEREEERKWHETLAKRMVEEDEEWHKTLAKRMVEEDEERREKFNQKFNKYWDNRKRD